MAYHRSKREARARCATISPSTTLCQNVRSKSQTDLPSLQPLRDFHEPRNLCATKTPASSWETPSSPLGCVPKETLGKTRTDHFAKFFAEVSEVSSEVSSTDDESCSDDESSSDASAMTSPMPNSTSSDTKPGVARIERRAALCLQKCRRTASVNAPGPVRSSVSRLVLLVKTRRAFFFIASHTSRSAGWPGAAANAQFSTCLRRTKCREYAISSVSNSPSQPTTSASFGFRNVSSGKTLSVSTSAYTPPCLRSTRYRKKSERSTSFGSDVYAS
mmetsp:Transcript_13546/g.56919  ORF Transcript_13546/g.56919 Transcript_13546/m.56919 type:complete len:274 (-) Transcript_13546:914-1735(-)